MKIDVVRTSARQQTQEGRMAANDNFLPPTDEELAATRAQLLQDQEEVNIQ